MGRQQLIQDSGAVLGGRRSDGPIPTSGDENDLIYRVWNKPNFGAMAKQGKSTPQRAALFEAIYDNLAPRPANVSIEGVHAKAWPSAWRRSVHIFQKMWEEKIGDELADIRAVHDDIMLESPEAPFIGSLVICAGGRASKSSIKHPLDIPQPLLARARWLPRIGWPADVRIDKDDCVGVMKFGDADNVYWQPVSIRGRSVTRIGSGDKHQTEAAAAEELKPLLAHLLSEREIDKKTGQVKKVLGRNLLRLGPTNPRRGSRPATVEDLTQTLGMRGVEFGTWINQNERQEVLNIAFDSFFDLCYVLKVPAAGGSFWGRAGLAFGSRGQGPGVLAHFEPGSWVIHMDRKEGAGALAHEMGHALDSALGEACGFRRGSFLSAGVTAGWKDHSVARMMDELFRTICKDPHGGPTQFLSDAKEFDAKSYRPYWSEPVELFARAFECWVFDELARGRRRNDFLVSKDLDEENPTQRWQAIRSPFPKGLERRRINAIMSEFVPTAMSLSQGHLESVA